MMLLWMKLKNLVMRIKKSHPLHTVKVKYEQWMAQIPVIEFNSGKYDIPYLIELLMKIDSIMFVGKNSNSFMCLQQDNCTL